MSRAIEVLEWLVAVVLAGSAGALAALLVGALV